MTNLHTTYVVVLLKKPCYVVDNRVMQSLYRNRNVLFRGFQKFFARKQQIPDKSSLSPFPSAQIVTLVRPRNNQLPWLPS